VTALSLIIKEPRDTESGSELIYTLLLCPELKMAEIGAERRLNVIKMEKI
jgi:hypothetical protein